MLIHGKTVEDTTKSRSSFSLSELNSLIKSVLDHALPDNYWVTAEIADLKCNQRGHCYLELVEKSDGRTLAQQKAVIWAYEYRKLSHKFEKTTGESLKPGMNVLVLVAVTYHEVYGLSLNIRDMDPTYTMGEMARKKKEVLERLRKKGIIDLNKALPLPLAPQRIAVISSPTAAGYGDFINHLENNPYGYKFHHILFSALMQGAEAEESIISALDNIKNKRDIFDAVVIIRGGGSAIDLNCYDGYPLASATARFPIPVLTGIGHEKDDSVVDMVAHTRLKTPTAAAEFLISGLRSFEENLLMIHNRLQAHTERVLKDVSYKLNALAQKLAYLPLKTAAAHQNRLLILRKDLENRVRELIGKEDNRLNAMGQAVRHLDPENVLKRGYSITSHKGKVLRDASGLRKWAVLETRLHKGTITSIVQDKKETKASEKKHADFLLPGFDRT